MQNFYAVKCIRYICTKGPPWQQGVAFEGASEFLSCYKLRGKSPEKPKGFSGRFKEVRREIEIPPGLKLQTSEAFAI